MAQHDVLAALDIIRRRRPAIVVLEEAFAGSSRGAALVTRLRSLRPALVVCEATGGFERAVIAALAAAGLPVVVANPRQVRDFARATGQPASCSTGSRRGIPKSPRRRGLP